LYLTVLGFKFIGCRINWSTYIRLNFRDKEKKKRWLNWPTWVCLELTVEIFDDSDVWFEFEHESLCADETGEKPISR
jgi:hypothetical protein